jgi:ubiquinone/menaquinone biosynthesis C-methylase UbiE
VSDGGGSAEDHKAAEVALHQTLAGYYEKRYGSAFSAIFQSFWNREFLDLVPPDASGPVLDAGCGTGILLEDLTQRFDEVYGVDLSPDMLAQVKVRSPRLKEVREGDIEATGFQDRFFGTVFCRGSLHHAASRERAFAEMARVLNPGGYLALTEPSDDFALVRWARAALYRLSSHFDVHDRAFRLRDIRDCLEAVGLEVVAVKRFGFLSYLFAGFPDILPVMPYIPGKVWLTRTLTRIDALLARIPGIRLTSFHLMVLARHKAGKARSA